MLYITLRQYEYILAVAETRSFTHAARQLNISQPALSVAITRAEAVLGASLFLRRKGSALQLTPFGHQIAEKARTLLQQAHDLEHWDNATPPVRIGCFQDIAPWYLAPALSMLQEACPEHQFDGFESRFADLASALEEGRLDLVISYDIGFPESFARRTLARVHPWAFLAEDHPLSQMSGLTLETVSQHPLILFEEEASELFMRDLMDKQGLTYDIARRVRSLELMRSFAAHGHGIGISYSSPPARMSYDGKSLRHCPITTPEAEVEIKVIWSDLTPPKEGFDQIVHHLSQALSTAASHR